MVVRVTGTGGIEKPNFALAHYEKYIGWVKEMKGEGAGFLNAPTAFASAD
jgi:hypothetical protein